MDDTAHRRVTLATHNPFVLKAVAKGAPPAGLPADFYRPATISPPFRASWCRKGSAA